MNYKDKIKSSLQVKALKAFAGELRKKAWEKKEMLECPGCQLRWEIRMPGLFASDSEYDKLRYVIKNLDKQVLVIYVNNQPLVKSYFLDSPGYKEAPVEAEGIIEEWKNSEEFEAIKKTIKPKGPPRYRKHRYRSDNDTDASNPDFDVEGD